MWQPSAAADVMRSAQLEFEKVRWKGGRPSLMALYYALDLLERAVARADGQTRDDLRAKVESLSKDLLPFLERFEFDRHEPIRHALQAITQALAG